MKTATIFSVESDRWPFGVEVLDDEAMLTTFCATFDECEAFARENGATRVLDHCE